MILVDDGLATGASMLAAVQALREVDPAEIVIAVPAAPESTCREFARHRRRRRVRVDAHPVSRGGESFWDFRQVSDDEVRELLATPTTGLSTARIRIAETPAEVIGRLAVDAPAGVPPREALEEIIGDARIVLIGESSHGTHEFYEARAEITKWLIEEKGFCAVAAEADWPDAYRVNRYVRGLGSDGSANEALSGFERFPAWMWRNVVVRDFVDWLHAHNGRRRETGERQTGFYGLDLYSLHRSMQEVIGYLDNVDPGGCGARTGTLCVLRPHLCRRRPGLRLRRRFRRRLVVRAPSDRATGRDAAQRARIRAPRRLTRRRRVVLRAAERADRPQRGGLLPCDVRWARHVVESTRPAHGRRRWTPCWPIWTGNADREPARIVVWAHNSHVGDARATEVGADGQLTLGQLVRERYGEDSRLIGFTTYCGTVTAASEWGGIAERKIVRPALNGSVEELLHETGRPEFLVSAMISRDAAEPLDVVRLGRAIGVIYLPATERQSHYYHVRPADQFDAIIHIDKTRALEPLEVTSQWVAGETPETYPTGL